MDRERSVLVVDDEEYNRDLLSRRLRRAGFHVEVADGGTSALERLQHAQVELILLDSMMPGMSGIELLKLLRGTYSQSEMPVIMATALMESEHVVEALSLGANDYVTKPIDFPVALARIRTQLHRKDADEALRVSEDRYALAALGANVGIWDWDIVSGQVYYSPRWMEILGHQGDEISNSIEAWFERVHSDDKPRLLAELDQCRRRGGPAELLSEQRLRHSDGTYRWIAVRAVVRRSATGAAVRIAGCMTDITADKTFDALTGLANRILFTEQLGACLAERGSNPSKSAAVLFLDIDHFKVVNDSLGHIAGELLLIEAARRLERAVGSSEDRPAGDGGDLIARFGGDEFAVLLPALRSFDEALPIAERILAEFQLPMLLEGRNVTLSASIGAAPVSADYDNPADILRDVDVAMYRAKALGRGCCVAFDASMRTTAMDRMDLESDLRTALERNEFVVFYQPKVDMDAERVVGFEALIRWRHPVKGLVPPDSFIPIAEQTGLILPIGLWVLRQACQAIRQWQIDFPWQPPLEVSVNLSVLQFRQPDLIERVREVIVESALNPAHLQLEITESVLIDDVERATAVLLALRDLGVGLKIDDFGTGYSSLQYLTGLPFDSLKIDRSFLTQMCEDEGAAEVVRNIVDLAARMNMEVIAEGVETAEQMAHLRSMGCKFGQGYFFSKPIPAEQIRELLAGESRLWGSKWVANAGSGDQPTE